MILCLIIFCYVILYYIILYCIILYYIILYYIILYYIILYYTILYIILYTHLPRAIKIHCEVVKESFFTWRSMIALRTFSAAAPPVPVAEMPQAHRNSFSSAQLGPKPRCGDRTVPTFFAYEHSHERFVRTALKPFADSFAQRPHFRKECTIFRYGFQVLHVFAGMVRFGASKTA